MEKHQDKSGLALAGVIVGGVAIALSAIPIINNFAFVLAVLALIFGAIGVKKSRGRGIAAIVLALVAAGIVIASQSIYGAALNKASQDLDKSSAKAQDDLDKSSGKKTDELLKNDVAVDLGAFSATSDQYGIVTTALPVTIHNKDTTKKSYSVEIEAVDASGSRIEQDTVYANDLGANQSQQFKAFQYVTSDKVAALKTATFKVLTVTQN